MLLSCSRTLSDRGGWWAVRKSLSVWKEGEMMRRRDSWLQTAVVWSDLRFGRVERKAWKRTSSLSYQARFCIVSRVVADVLPAVCVVNQVVISSDLGGLR